MEQDGFRLPLAEAGIRFLKPAVYDDVLLVHSWIKDRPGARLRIGYEIANDAGCLATGYTVHVFTDCAMQPVRPPKAVRDLLTAAWLAAGHSGEEGHDR
jgi:acyl-CoA thioester hydrolase